MSDLRYGVFLRPDPATCWAVTQLTTALERQYGIVSAAAFPPHITLVGNLATGAGLDAVAQALAPVFGGTAPIAIENAGPTRVGDCVLDVDDGGGPLTRLAAAVHAAVLPLSEHVEDHDTVPVRDASFRGHISLASHDLYARGDLAEEVEGFIDALYPTLAAPERFVADWCALYEFEADWSQAWWHDLRWWHRRSWRLTPTGEA